MPTVVGVSFKPVTKVYYFDPGVFVDLQAGDYVVVETSQGREVGQVVWQPRKLQDNEVSTGLKPVVRRATPLDLIDRDRLHRSEAEATSICRAKAAEHGLDMKVISAEYSFDGSRLVVNFSSEGRIDFRDLVRDLAKTFATRIEMKQIGVRDEAKELSGVGKCGRQLCCASWLREFNPVTIKMAKQQNLPLNPPEISGVCGRLLCCLSYEMDVYEEARARLPKVGAAVDTPHGKGRVRKVHALRDTVSVRLDEDETLRDYPVEELSGFSVAGKGKSCGCSGCAARTRPAAKDVDADLLSASEFDAEWSTIDEPPAKQVKPESDDKVGRRRRKRGSG
jgi:cell fate regulator YaaT (PSP1 superfamily)